MEVCYSTGKPPDFITAFANFSQQLSPATHQPMKMLTYGRRHWPRTLRSRLPPIQSDLTVTACYTDSIIDHVDLHTSTNSNR